MTPRTPLNLEDMPDSPFACELARLPRRLRFAPELEAEYRSFHLHRVRFRARVWCAIALAFALAYTVNQLLTEGPYTFYSLLHVGVLVPLEAFLVLFAWSHLYFRFYLRAARFATILLGALIGWFISQSVDQGHEEELVLLSVQMIAVFFFMGLTWGAALTASVTTIASFALGAMLFGLAGEQAVKCTFFLCIAGAVAAFVSLDAERSYRTAFLERGLIGELAERDGLTGLKNRRAFDEHLSRVWLQAQRDELEVAVLMIDVDRFKRYNDTYGHQAGDSALRQVARAAGRFARRPLDMAARYGGEELALILYDLTPRNVLDIAQRIRTSVQDLALEHGENRPDPIVTVSVGVAVVRPTPHRKPDGALQLADQALYEAKSTGRNRVVIKGEEDYRALVTGRFRNLQQFY